LAYVRYLMRGLFEAEARLSPLVAPALHSMTIASGKLLRPFLVLLGARLVSGPDGDYGRLPAPPTAFDDSILPRLTESIFSQMRRHGVKRPEDIDTSWRAAPAFPGGLPQRIYILAAALEILHLATLTHDDVIDDSPERRGQPSARQSVGVQHAVLLGDLLLTLCFSLINETGDAQTGQLLAGMVRLMVRSEFMQAMNRRQLATLLERPSLRQHNRIIGGKTALLFTLALSCGAAELAADRTSLEKLRRAGYNLGLAFQLDDDRLDFLADRQAFGKPPGQDLRDGQLTLPLISALLDKRPANRAARRELRELVLRFHEGDEGCFGRLVELVERLGGFAASRRLSANYLAKADGELRSLVDRYQSRQTGALLGQLLGFLASRDY